MSELQSRRDMMAHTMTEFSVARTVDTYEKAREKFNMTPYQKQGATYNMQDLLGVMGGELGTRKTSIEVQNGKFFPKLSGKPLN